MDWFVDGVMTSDLFSIIAAADDLEKHTERVPEWGVTVTVRQLNLSEVLQLKALSLPDHEVPGWVLARTMMTADGRPAFDDLEAAASMLNKKGAAVERLCGHVFRMTGITSGSEDDEEDELAGN